MRLSLLLFYGCGYSMNESVVIFDRVRESTHTHKRSDTFADLANASITQSIHRSFYTLATVMFACVSLYLFGGDTTKNFCSLYDYRFC